MYFRILFRSLSEGAEWSFKNHESHKIFVEFHGSMSHFLAVTGIRCVWQSLLFYKAVLQSRFFCKAKNVLKYRFAWSFFFLHFFFKWCDLRVLQSEPLKSPFKTPWSLNLTIIEAQSFEIAQSLRKKNLVSSSHKVPTITIICHPFYSLTWSLCSKSTPPLSNRFKTWVQLPSLTALRNPPSFTVISCKMNHSSLLQWVNGQTFWRKWNSYVC